MALLVVDLDVHMHQAEPAGAFLIFCCDGSEVGPSSSPGSPLRMPAHFRLGSPQLERSRAACEGSEDEFKAPIDDLPYL